MSYRFGKPVTLPVQNVGVGFPPLPIPSTTTDGALLDPLGLPRRRIGDVADIAVRRTGPTSFTLPGPVFLYAFVDGNFINGVGLPGMWLNADTLELTGMDLTDSLNGGISRGKSYRVHISPYWSRLVLVAPNWLFAAGQTINTYFLPYVS